MMTGCRRRLIGLAIAVAVSTAGGGVAKAVVLTATELEGFLRLPDQELTAFGNGPAVQGTALQREFMAGAGSVLSFNFNFLTNELLGLPGDIINDFAFVTITSTTGAIILAPTQLADVAGTNFPLVSSPTRFESETGFRTFTSPTLAAGTYRLAIGVVNVTDELGESGLLIDNLTLTPGSLTNGGFEGGNFSGFTVFGEAMIVGTNFGSSAPGGGTSQALLTTVNAIPEPSSLALAGMGVVGLAGFGWCRRKRSAA